MPGMPRVFNSVSINSTSLFDILVESGCEKSIPICIIIGCIVFTESGATFATSSQSASLDFSASFTFADSHFTSGFITCTLPNR
jgi:hypothetical protein